MTGIERTERYAWVLSILVSIVAVSVIGLSARRVLPAALVPSAPAWLLAAIPHVNAALVLLALGTLIIGYRAIKRRDVQRHRASMVTTAVLFFSFLALYLLRLANLGTTTFPGPEPVARYLYYPVLAVHMVFAIVCIPLVLYGLIVGVTVDSRAIARTAHPRVGGVAVWLWGISFALGFVVYLLLHHAF